MMLPRRARDPEQVARGSGSGAGDGTCQRDRGFERPRVEQQPKISKKARSNPVESLQPTSSATRRGASAFSTKTCAELRRVVLRQPTHVRNGSRCPCWGALLSGLWFSGRWFPGRWISGHWIDFDNARVSLFLGSVVEHGNAASLEPPAFMGIFDLARAPYPEQLLLREIDGGDQGLVPHRDQSVRRAGGTRPALTTRLVTPIGCLRGAD